MNYGGTLPEHAGEPGAAGAGRRPRRRLQPDRQQGGADPRHRLFPRRPDPASGDGVADPARAGVPHQLLGPSRPARPHRPLLTPDFSAYQHTALASPYPDNGVGRRSGARAGRAGRLRASVRLGHRSGQGEVADATRFPPTSRTARSITTRSSASPITARPPRSGTGCSTSASACPPGAGTDAMANYASLRGPVGMNRVLLDTGGDIDARARSTAALKAGRTFVSNGPLLGLEVGGSGPAALFRAPRPARSATASRCARPWRSIISNWCTTVRW